MGLYPAPSKCYFSDLDTLNIGGNEMLMEYKIDVGATKYIIRIDPDLNIETNDFLKLNKFIFKGLILNQLWPWNKQVITSEDDLKAILNQSNFPRTAKERLDNILLYMYKSQEYDGHVQSFKSLFGDLFSEQLFFRNDDELNYYINGLDQQGYIEISSKSNDGYNILVTFEGLEYVINIQEHGFLSNNCFVAMSFGKDMIDIRNAIKEVVNLSGYNPILVDEIVIDSDQTINDAIIASLKSSKFCIADFTEQKFGVYFEAGYALGRNQRVIYTCRDDWFDKSHFDTNHFPHIVYKDIPQLKKELKDRITAWIQ